MSKRFSVWRDTIFLILLCAVVPSRAWSLQLLTLVDPSFHSPSGGGGDSWQPIITPDGRYVLFASRANNLVLSGTNSQFVNQVPPKMNVFLRDRTNGTTTLVSINVGGIGPGNGDSIPTGFSTNGQFALFESTASDLMPGTTNNTSNVFLRDLLNGTNQLISVSTNGGWANASSWESALTPDGRYVAFASAASNVVTSDNNQIQDIFVRDTQTGVTTLVSTGVTAGSSVARFDSPVITPDGRYVGFRGTATNILTSPSDIYVRDLVSGTTVVASANATNVILNGTPGSYNHLISDDGLFVVFESSSTGSSAFGVIQRYNLKTGFTDVINTNAVAAFAYNHFRSLDMTPDGRFVAFIGYTNTGGTNSCVYVWDAQSGVTTLASAGPNGILQPNSVCEWPTLDASGRLVAFLCTDTNLTTNTVAGDFHLYVHELLTGVTTLVDANLFRPGVAKDFLSAPRLTPDGGSLAFDCTLAGFGYIDKHVYDVFAASLTSGVTEFISVHQPSLETRSFAGGSLGPVFSASTDGRYLAFSGTGPLVLNFTNQYRSVFVLDQLTGTGLASVDRNGLGEANGWSFDPSLSGDGRFVAFTSGADNLVMGDTNQAQDVFVRDRQSGTISLVSVNTNGTAPGNGASYSPKISTNGRYVLFHSKATTLAAGTSLGHENIFVRDLQSGATYGLTTSVPAPPAAMTPDGKFVAFSQNASVVVWSSQTAAVIYTHSAASPVTAMTISPDGTRIGYSSTTETAVVDRMVNSSVQLGAGYSAAHIGLQFSGDSRYLVFAITNSLAANDQNSVADVYLYDFQTQSNQLVSVSCNSANAANGPSDSPTITDDGRFIAYRSSAVDIVPGATNGQPAIYLYDRQTGDTTLASVSSFGNFAGNNRSLAPAFSGDGQTLFFQSWSSDLVAQDFNQGADFFSLKLYSSVATPAFVGQIIFAPASGRMPTLTWPAVTGKNYQVQFKDNLSDPVWQSLNGDVTVVGDRGSATDFAPGSSQRFYRIVAY